MCLLDGKENKTIMSGLEQHVNC